MKPAAEKTAAGLLSRLDPESLQAVTNSGLHAGRDTQQLALEAIDIALLINEEEKFLQAAMVLCNELNARFKATQVSLGWIDSGHVHLRAVSNTQRFQKKADVVRHLQWAMEEAADQDEEVVYPKAPDDTYVYREHEKYLHQKDMASGVSLPLRLGSEVIAVITLERADEYFTSTEVKCLRLVADLLARRLQDLEHQSQWLHRRFLRGARRVFGWVFGFEHTWTKVGLLAAVIAIAALFFWPFFYRVEAPITLKPDTQVHLPAPFDGFVEEVFVRKGDPVHEGDLLLTLDRRELIIQEAESLAKISRHETEARTAQNMGRISDANLARLQTAEEEARLDMVRHRLQLAELRAPRSGIIVEGDLMERIGAPLTRGEPIFRIALLDDMHLQLEIDQRYIHEVHVGQEGEFAFASRPEQKYRFAITALEPSAVPKAEGTVFIARARLLDPSENWWRPGMNGVAKVDVGYRTPIWVLTKRLIDFIRMKLWI